MYEDQWLREAVVSGQVASGEHQHKDASERFTQQSFSAIARWEDESWSVRGNIEQPAADTGAASAVTFCLHALPASITEKRISSPRTCQLSDDEKKKRGGAGTHSDLDFVGVELGLDGGESSQLSKLEKEDEPNKLLEKLGPG